MRTLPSTNHQLPTKTRTHKTRRGFLSVMALALANGARAAAMSMHQQLFLLCVRNAPPTPPLPYDAEVEYIESTTGKERIYTGIKGSEIFSHGGLEVDFTMVQMNAFSVAAGISDDYDLNFWGMDNITNRIYARLNGVKYSYGAQTFGLVDFVGVRAVAKADDGTNEITINGTTKSFTYQQLCKDSSNQLVVPGTSAGWWYPHFRIHRVKVWNNGRSLVRDMVPVRIEQEGAMYDRVSGELFRNARTGSFAIGSDK